MAKALIIVHDGFTDSEYTYALDRCREEDIDAYVATVTGNDAVGEKGWKAKARLGTANAYLVAKNPGLAKFYNLLSLGDDFSGLFDILLLPGGVKSIEKVRQDISTIYLIALHNMAGKVIGSMCHGAQLLIEAGLVKNRKISGYYSIKTDIVNAGGEYCDHVVRDGNIISAPHYDFNGKWMKAVIEAWKEIK